MIFTHDHKMKAYVPKGFVNDLADIKDIDKSEFSSMFDDTSNEKESERK